MDLSVTIISSVALALIYVFIIKPRQDKKNAGRKASDACVDVPQDTKQDETLVMRNQEKEGESSVRSTNIPDLEQTKTVVWMAHCINFPFLPMDKNIKINMEFMSLLNDLEEAVKADEKERTIEIYNKFQDKMKEKLGSGIDNPMVNLNMFPFKICALSKDLLDLYKMVIEGRKDEDVLGGKGSIKRILKYSIELGSPSKTLDALTDYFVNNSWFDNMQEQDEWLKQAYECTMVSGNRDLGHEILEHLEVGLEDEEKGELLNHAHEFRHQIDVSWIN